MNLLQLRTLARQRLNDVTTSPLLWSDDELNSYINQAIVEAAIRSRCLVDSTTADCCEIDVVAGTADYLLNPVVFEVKRVFDATNKRIICRKGFNDLNFRPDWQSVSGKPKLYMLDLNNLQGETGTQLTLYPNPDENLTLNLTVYRVPLADLADDEDVPEISVLFHADLIHWVCHLAYMKQDADTLDVGKSLQFQAQFAECFGMKQSARQLEWRRKHRLIQTKGQYF